jgi:hypothetical protein
VIGVACVKGSEGFVRRCRLAIRELGGGQQLQRLHPIARIEVAALHERLRQRDGFAVPRIEHVLVEHTELLLRCIRLLSDDDARPGCPSNERKNEEDASHGGRG